MRLRSALITIALLLAAGMGLLIVCAVPTSPLDDPANFRLTLSTPQHADSIYYVGDTLRLLLKTDMNTTGRSLNVNISSLQRTYFDTTMALSGKDSIALKYALNEIADLRISAKATLSDKSIHEVSSVVYVKGRSPQIVSQSDTAIICSLGVRCSLWVAAQGTPPLRFQWYKGNLAIADTFAYYAKNHVVLSDSGEYFCIVSNGWNPTDTSKKIRVMVRDTANNPPHFLTQSFTMTIAKGATEKSAVPIIAKDTIDRDSVFLHIDAAQTVLPAQSAASIDSSKFLNVAIPQNATIGNSYKIAIIADDHKGGLDTLVVSVSVFDPTASDTIRPTITADPGNPANGSIVADSVLSLRFVIQDFNGIYKAGFVNFRAPNDTQPLTAANGSYALIVQLKHGIDSSAVFAIDNSVNRNRQTAKLAYIYNRNPALVLKSPVNGAQAISRNTPFFWKATDADGDSVAYSFSLGTLSTQLEQVAQTRDTTYNASSRLFAGQEYYWRVIASDEWSSDTSLIRTFTVNYPPQIALAQPSNASSQVNIPVTLGWSGSDIDPADSVKFDLYFAENDSPFGNLITNSKLNSFLLANLEYGETYKWKIVASDGKESRESPVQTFTTFLPFTFDKMYGVNNNDYGYFADQISDSSYAVVGVLVTNTNPYESNVRYIELTKSGDVKQTTLFGTAGFNSVHRYIRLPNGNIAFGGGKGNATNSNCVPWLFEINSSNQIVFDSTYAASGENYPSCFAQTNDGGFILASTASSQTYLRKMDANGRLLFTKSIFPTQNRILCIEQTYDNRYLLGGYSGESAFLAKIDINGDTLWTLLVDSLSRVSSIKRIGVSDVILAGSTIGNKLALCRMDQYRNFLWSKQYGTADLTIAEAAAITSDGGIIAAGRQNTLGNTDGYLLRTNSNGDSLWVRIFKDGIINSVQETIDKGFILTGNKIGLWVVKTDPLGKVH